MTLMIGTIIVDKNGKEYRIGDIQTSYREVWGCPNGRMVATYNVGTVGEIHKNVSEEELIQKFHNGEWTVKL